MYTHTHTGKQRDHGRHNAFRARCPSEIHFLLGGDASRRRRARSGNEPETGNKSATTAAAAATTYHLGGGSVRVDFIYPLRYINIRCNARFCLSDLIYERVKVENANRTASLVVVVDVVSNMKSNGGG